jgi:hypothetical protein
MRTHTTAVRAWIVALASFAVLAVMAQGADAGSPKALAKYRGQVLVSDTAFSVLDDDAAMLAELKKQTKTVLEHTAESDEGATWDFFWLGVLKAKPGTSKAVIAFIDTKTGTQATYKELTCAPDQDVIAADLQISENDGLTKGKTYELVITVQKGGKPVVLARGKATFK